MSRSILTQLTIAALVATTVIAQEPTSPAVSEGEDKETEPQVLTTIHGQLVNEMGAGVANAQATAVKLQDESIRGQAKTDAFGDFTIEIEGAHPGKFKLTAVASGFSSRVTEFEIFADDLEPFVDLVLQGDLTLVGEVVEFLESNPLVGARVFFKSVYRNDSTTTDEAGRFEFKNLTEGEVVLVAEADGFGRARVKTIVEPVPKTVQIVLKPERIVHLSIQDDEGNTVPEVSVEMVLEGQDDYRSLQTNQDGKLTIDKIPYDTEAIRIRLAHRDYVITGKYDYRVALAPEQFETREMLTLQPAAGIRGTIIDGKTKRPLNGVRVDVGYSLRYGMPHTFTNLNGEYEITGLHPGHSVVTAQVTGYAPDLAEVTTRPRESRTVDFQLHGGRTVSGVIRDAEGEPIAGAEVVSGKWRDYETLGIAEQSDSQGRFVLRNCPVDEFVVNVSAPGIGALYDRVVSAGRDEYTFTLEPGEVEALADSSISSARPGQVMPDIPLTALDGTRFDRARLKGRYVLLDFWATWCGPCVAEIPEFKRIHEAFGKQSGFEMIGISSDFDTARLKDFVNTRHLSWPQVQGPGSGAEEMGQALGIRAIPCTILVDPEGKIIEVGLLGDALYNKIKESLEEP